MLSREKNKVIYLHFILSVLVILIHSINNETKFENIFSMNAGLGQFAVPLFFMISGFLFFRTANTFDDVKHKINRRIYTLVIPYALWNLIYYVIYLIRTPGTYVSIWTIEDAMFNFRYNPAFWFMFQLILLTAITPILFFILKKFWAITIFYIVLYILIILDIDIPFINEDALIYFFSGAIFSKLYNRHKVQFVSKKSFVFALIVFIVCFCLNRFAYNLTMAVYIFRTFYIATIILERLAGCFLLFYFIDLIFNYDKVYAFMYDTFFLYAIHYMIVRGIAYALTYVEGKIALGNFALVLEIIVFLLSPVICVVISYHVSNILKKNAPKLYNYLSGYRN